MKKSKKITAVLMAWILMLGCFQLAVYAEDEVLLSSTPTVYTYGDYQWIEPEDGTASIYKYTGSSAVIAVPATIESRTVTGIEHYAFSECTSLTNVVLPDTVTSIGYRAFAFCTNLQSINYPLSWTACKSEYASIVSEYTTGSIFEGCTKLHSITVPASVTRIPDYAFSCCNCLQEIRIEGPLTAIGNYVFSHCKKLQSISIPSSVTSIGHYAFDGCSSLTAVTVPDTVTSIGYRAFAFCTNLQSINYPLSWTACKSEYANIVSEYTAGSIFEGCTKLHSITVPASVTRIPDYAFSCCNCLQEIRIEAPLTAIGNYVFYHCKKLQSISIPSSVTSIGHYAFDGCSSLTAVAVPDSVSSIGYRAFAFCTNLQSINYPLSWTTCKSEYTSIFSEYTTGSIFEGCRKLKSVSVPEGITTLPAYVFCCCDYLQSVVLPSTLKNINAYAFYNCTRLKTLVKRPSAENNLIDYIGERAFYSCAFTSFSVPYSERTILHKDAFLNASGYNNNYYTYTFFSNAPDIGITKVTGLSENSILTNYPVPQWPGHTFQGWFTNDNCTGQPWDFTKNPITSDMTFYASWGSAFSLPDNTLPFLNSVANFCGPGGVGTHCYEISDADFKLVLKNCTNFINRYVVKKVQERHWCGSCFGMSAVTMLTAMGYLNPNHYGASSISELYITLNNTSSDVGAVESLVNFYYLLQGASDGLFQSHTTESDALEAVYTKLSRGDGNPVMVTLSLHLNDGRTGGHAVVAYGLTDNKNGTFTTNIYDCSLSRYTSYPLTIFKSGDFYAKGCTQWESAWDASITIDGALDCEDFLLTAPYLLFEEAGEACTMITDYDCFTVSDGINTTSFCGGEISGTDNLSLTVYGYQNEPGGSILFKVGLPVIADKSYTITPAEGNDAYQTMLYSLTGDGFFHCLESGEPVQMKVSADGSIETAAEEMTNQALTTSLQLNPDSAEGALLTCETTGLRVSTSEGITHISAQEETQLQFTLMNELAQTTADETILIGSDGIQVCKDESGSQDCIICQNDQVITGLSLDCSVVFHSQGGSAVPTVFAAPDTVISRPEDPQLEGYDFTGWFLDEACMIPWSFADPVTGDLLLYAGWKPAAKCIEQSNFTIGTDSVSVVVTNNTESSAALYVLFSTYNSAGQMESCSCVPVTIDTGDHTEVSAPLTDTDSISFVKCIITDTNLLPVSEASMSPYL